MPHDTLKPLVVRRRPAANMIGCGTSKLDELISLGEIKAVKSGKQLLIPMAELERFVERLPSATLKLPVRLRKMHDATERAKREAASDSKTPPAAERSKRGGDIERRRGAADER
jgi:excisionase family DNA binding protein